MNGIGVYIKLKFVKNVNVFENKIFVIFNFGFFKIYQIRDVCFVK